MFERGIEAFGVSLLKLLSTRIGGIAPFAWMDSENSTVSVTSSVTRLRNASFVVVPHAQFLSAYPSSLFTLYENCEVIALSSACDRALLEPLLPDVHRLHSAWLFAECPAVDVVKEALAEKVLAEKVLAEEVLTEKETLTQTKTITDVKNTHIIEGWKHHERIPIACEANTFVSMLLRVSARVLSKT